MTFANYVHQFDACQRISNRAKGFKVEHRSGHALDGTMVLLDDAVEILDLANLDRHVPIIIYPIDGRFVGSAFVPLDLFWIAVIEDASPFRKTAWLPPYRALPRQTLSIYRLCATSYYLHPCGQTVKLFAHHFPEFAVFRASIIDSGTHFCPLFNIKKIPEPVVTHLKLNEEPLADTARYDSLHDQEVAHV